MTTEHEINTPRISVTFTRSPTKDGGRGYTINVQEGADEDEAARVMLLAARLKNDAEEVVKNE